jgi:hypothetical protein
MSAQLFLFLSHPWNIVSYFGNACSSQTGVDCSDTGLPHPGGGDVGSSQLNDILQIVFAVLAALAVLFIVVAGLRLIIAQGNPQEVSKAKSTIIYALAGLLVALLGEALVAFTLGHLN